MKERLLTACVYGIVVVCAGALVVLGLSQQAPALEISKSTACMTLSDVESALTRSHERFVVLDSTSLLSVAAQGLGKVLIHTVAGHLAIGFEVNGCMEGPMDLGAIVPTVGA